MADSDPRAPLHRIDLAGAADFDIGGLAVSPARCEVRLGGEQRTLQPRVMKVLVALAAARPGVVSRDRLVETCWDGVIVGDDALNRCILALRHLARDFAPAPFAIETVPRVGYALVERGASCAAAPAPSAAGGRSRRRIGIAAILLVVLAALAIAVGWSRLGRTEAEPAIAVLPFRSLSAGDDYFAEGVAESILNQLARQSGLRVAGRTSSWLFRDRAADFRDIGRRLDVGYVLEGSVRRAGDRVRVEVALVGTRDGMRLWSQGYEGGADDIFAIERRVGGEVTARMLRQLAGREQAGAPPATSAEVYSLYLSARGLLRTREYDNMATARRLLERGVRLDPDYAPAQAELAKAHWFDYRTPMAARRAEARRRAERALALRPDLADAHAVLGLTLGSEPRAIRHLERAVAIDPSHSEAWLWLAAARGRLFDFDGELQAMRRLAAIDPFWIRANQGADNAWQLGRRDEALAMERRLIARHPEPAHREMARARIARRAGDWSAYVAHQLRAAELDPDLARQARGDAHWVAALLGLPIPDPPFDHPYVRLWREMAKGRLPSLSAFRAAMGNAREYWDSEALSPLASPLFLARGRSVELVSLYDEAFGSPEAFLTGDGDDGALFQGPLVAMALRQAGRGAEADRLLAGLDREMAPALAQLRVPGDILGKVARLRAVQGRRVEALELIERAQAMGWPQFYAPFPRNWFGPLDQDPAFAPLRGEPRFERIAQAHRALIARERRDIAESGVLRRVGG